MTKLESSQPAWVRWFQDFGTAVADLGSSEVGETSPRIVISVPTGQFAVWMLATGAFQSEATNKKVPEIGVRYSGWFTRDKRMDDFEFIRGDKPDRITFKNDVQTSLFAEMPRPLKVLPDGTPEGRAGQGVGKGIRNQLRKLGDHKKDWTLVYADQCLSPVVIIGTGREYLHNQRIELLEKVPIWVDSLSQILLSEDSQQTSNPERMYFHPFMVFSSGVGHARPWLRQMTPKISIFTSWSAFEAKHHSLFSCSPQIVLANRRVEKSLVAANYVQGLEPDPRVERLLKELKPPKSVYVRSFASPVLEDTGESENEEDFDDVVDI